MFYLILTALVGIATGWFLHGTALTWAERIKDWRKPALWVFAGILDIIGLIVLSHYLPL